MHFLIRELETTYKASKKKNSIGVAGELEREEVIIPVRMRDYGSYLAAAAYVLVGFCYLLEYYIMLLCQARRRSLMKESGKDSAV